MADELARLFGDVKGVCRLVERTCDDVSAWAAHLRDEMQRLPIGQRQSPQLAGAERLQGILATLAARMAAAVDEYERQPPTTAERASFDKWVNHHR